MNKLNLLADKSIELCERKNWKLDWLSRGGYLHLEVSEFIESLRGKTGDPVEEAGDVLIVLLSMIRGFNLDMDTIVDNAIKKIESL